MKNCPFCKAEIEDNARFCLYCMKPLEEKQVIEASPKRRKIWILPAIGLVLCLTIAAIVLLIGPESDSSVQPENTPAATDTVEVDATTDDPSEPFEDVVPSIEQPDGQNPKVVFEYREVGPNDYFSPDSYIPGSDLVITGVKNPTPDGIYEVPSYLDGKRVVGIMSLAFSGTDVQKVTLGETIIRINQNAFSGCYNLESLYVKSDRLFLSRSAFVDATHRNCTLTIYCSAACTVDDDLYGERNLKDIARTLGAVWEEWNG